MYRTDIRNDQERKKEATINYSAKREQSSVLQCNEAMMVTIEVTRAAVGSRIIS